MKTAEQIKADFLYRGESIAAWARQHNFDANLVCHVLSGNRPCRRGQSHDIAVALGLKDGVPRNAA